MWVPVMHDAAAAPTLPEICRCDPVIYLSGMEVAWRVNDGLTDRVVMT